MDTRTELDLISKHRTIEKRIDELRLDLYYSEEAKKELIKNELSKLTEEKEIVEQELKNVSEKPITRIKRDNVLQTLRIVISKLKLNPGGNPISRDQGTIIHNAIFGHIIWDIKIGFDNDYRGHSIPTYYHEIDGDFDHTKLKEILEIRLKELNGIVDHDYLSLKDFVDILANQIRELAWITK